MLIEKNSSEYDQPEKNTIKYALPSGPDGPGAPLGPDGPSTPLGPSNPVGPNVPVGPGLPKRFTNIHNL